MLNSELWLNPIFWLLALPGVFLTGISKSGFAGGAGVVAVPILALVIAPSTALVLILPLLLLMDAQTIAYHRKQLVWQELKIIVPAALVGVLLGSVVLRGLSDAVLQAALGVISLLFAAQHLWKPRIQFSRAAAGVFGSIAGLTSTLIHAGGPPLNMYLAGRGLDRVRWISTAAVFFASINFAKLFAYAAIGLWQPELIPVSIILVPVAIAGVYAGHRIQVMISEASFVRAIMLFLAISGVLLIARSVAGA